MNGAFRVGYDQFGRYVGAVSFGQIIDGLSNTILVGEKHAQRQGLWSFEVLDLQRFIVPVFQSAANHVLACRLPFAEMLFGDQRLGDDEMAQVQEEVFQVLGWK